jgi:hypothetical protein
VRRLGAWDGVLLPSLDPPEHGAHGHAKAARGNGNFGENSRSRRFDLEGRLFGFDFDDGLAQGDLGAGFHEPVDKIDGVDVRGGLGHPDLDVHCGLLPS